MLRIIFLHYLFFLEFHDLKEEYVILFRKLEDTWMKLITMIVMGSASVSTPDTIVIVPTIFPTLVPGTYIFKVTTNIGN